MISRKRVAISAVFVMLASVLLCACGKKVHTIPADVIATLAPENSGNNVIVVGGDTGGESTLQPGTNTQSGISAQPGATDGSQVVVITPIPVPATPVPTPMPTPVPTPVPTPTPIPYVTITKDPTGETVREGDTALFIAYANNFDSINWILVSPDASTSFRAESVGQYFKGVSIDGQGTTGLYIYNIPSSMDGWRVQCYFTGYGGPEYTKGAYISVKQYSGAAFELASACSRFFDDYANKNGIASLGIYDYSYAGGQADFVCRLKTSRYTINIHCRSFQYNDAFYAMSIDVVDGNMVTTTTMNTSYGYDKAYDEVWNETCMNVLRNYVP